MSTVLKAEVQAKINAATVATPSMELANLRVTGQRLGCDLANLNSVSVALGDTTTSATPLTEMGVRARALPATDTASTGAKISAVLPFNVEAGDVIYADDVGLLFKNSAHDASTAIINIPATDRDILLVGAGSYCTGNSFSTQFLARLALPDGNVLIGVGSTSTVLQLRVMSSDLRRQRSTAFYQLLNGASEVAGNLLAIGIFPTATANQFAFYFLTEFNSQDFSRYLLRRCLITYNPVNGSITTSGTSTVFSNPSGRTIERYGQPHISGRYVLLTWQHGVNYMTGVLDTEAGTVTEHTFNNGQSPVFLAEFTPGDGIQRWLVRRGGSVHMLRATAAASDAVPPNVATLMNSNFVNVVSTTTDLMVTSTAAGVYRLVRFSNDASTADIFTLGVDGDGVYTTAPTGMVQNGNEYSVVLLSGETLLSFTWDGAAVAGLRYSGRDYHGIAPVNGFFNTMAVVSIVFSAATVTNALFWTQATLSAVIHEACSPIAVADVAAVAGMPVSMTITPGAMPYAQSAFKAVGQVAALGFRQLNPIEYIPYFEAFSWFDTSNNSFGAVGSTPNNRYASTGLAIYSESGGSFVASCNSGSTQLLTRALLRRGTYRSPINTSPARAAIKINHPVVFFTSAGGMTVTKLGALR